MSPKLRNVRMHIYRANHEITELNLPNIFSHMKSNMCDSRKKWLVIFVSDFQLHFEVPVEIVLKQMNAIMEYVEARGHVLIFAFLPNVPAYSRNPKVRPTYTPFPDHTDYVVKIKDQIDIFGSLIPLGSCFSNKRDRCLQIRIIIRGRIGKGSVQRPSQTQDSRTVLITPQVYRPSSPLTSTNMLAVL